MDPALGGPLFLTILINPRILHLYLYRVRTLNLWLLTAFMAINLIFGHHWVHVPALLQHYEEHCAMEKNDMSFMDFLVLHYADTDHGTSEGSHQDLPFKHDHKEHIGVDHVFWSPILSSHHLFLPIELAMGSADQRGPLDGHCAASLQPPRTV